MNIDHLPEDVFVEILSWLQPRLPLDYENERSRGRKSSAVYDRFWKDQHLIGNLRLVSRDMNAGATPFYYEETLINLTAPSLDALNTLFSLGGKFIRTLVIDGRDYKTGSHNSGHNEIWFRSRGLPHRPDITQAIGEGLAKCSQLRRLDALGDHGLFPSRKWLKNPRVSLPNLTSLVYTSRNGIGLSHCLVGLGGQLTSLTIQGENFLSLQPRVTFHLPSTFPKLEYLHVDGYLNSKSQLGKLFSRLHAKEPHALGSRPGSPLRCFVITGDSKSSLRDRSALLIQDLLPANAALYLTTLHFLPWQLVHTEYATDPRRNVPMHEIMQTFSKACPNLHELSIPCSRFCDRMDCLPPKLKHLSVIIDARPRQHAVTVLTGLAESLTSNSCARSRLLTLVIMDIVERVLPRRNLKIEVQSLQLSGAQVEIASHPYLTSPSRGLKITYLPGCDATNPVA